jgi:hypothetical protein
MPRMGFEPTITVFEGTKTVHALDCAATVISQAVTLFFYLGPVRLQYSSSSRTLAFDACISSYSVDCNCLNSEMQTNLFFLLHSQGRS